MTIRFLDLIFRDVLGLSENHILIYGKPQVLNKAFGFTSTYFQTPSQLHLKHEETELH